MLSENIKALRKQKGYSQETLAQQLNVVRQTVSKWEKGLSVPDAEMLERMAALFEVSTDALLEHQTPETAEPSEIGNIARQLAVLNEQLAAQQRSRKRFWKIVLIVIPAVLLVMFALFVIAGVTFRAYVASDGPLTTTELHCSLNGEDYYYEVTYDDQYRIRTAGGDGWVADHVQTEQYSDANVLIAQIEDYFTDRGGTCTRTERAP